MLEQFIEIVESLTNYNTENSIRAIPILIYHGVEYSIDDLKYTSRVIWKRMRYLFENEVTIFRMEDIVYKDRELRFKGY